MDTEQLLHSFLEASPSTPALNGSVAHKIFFAAIGQLSGGAIRLTPRDNTALHTLQLLQSRYADRLQLHEVYSFGLAADTFKEESKRHWRTTGHLLTLDGAPILSVRCHEDGEAAVQVLHKQAVTALCNVVIEGLQDALLRHIDQQNTSFNASAFFSDYRRVMPHGGGFFQLHAPRELDDFSSVTDRYRMYLLGKEGMPTRLSRFLGWSADSSTQARFASEVGEVEVDARDVLFYVGVQEDRQRLLKLSERAARPTSWALRQRIHYDPFDTSPYSVVLEQAFHGHLHVETVWVYFVKKPEAVAFCEHFRGPQMGALDDVAPSALTALGVTKLEGAALGKLTGQALAPAPQPMAWGQAAEQKTQTS